MQKLIKERYFTYPSLITESMEKLSRILIVDDSRDDVELILTALQEFDLTDKIDVVYDGQEALDYLFYRREYVNRKKSVPAFILLDLKMQKMDGTEVLKTIRTSEDLKYLPVVILSSSRMETDIIRCYHDGANAYVVKPVDFNELVKMIKGIAYFWSTVNISPVKL
jgi:CheY-like chemotaxis protein